MLRVNRTDGSSDTVKNEREELNSIEQRKHDAESRIVSAGIEYAELVERIAEKKKELDGINLSINFKSTDLEKIKKDYEHASDKYRALEGELQMENACVDVARKERDEIIRMAKDEAERIVSQAKEESSVISNAVVIARQEFNSLKERAEESESKMRLAESARSIMEADIKRIESEVYPALQTAQAQLEITREQYDALKKESDTVQSTNDELRSERSKLKDELAELTAALTVERAKLAEEYDKLAKKEESIEKRIEISRQVLEQIEFQYERFSRLSSTPGASNKIAELKELVASLKE